jgi:integrase
VLGAHLDEYVGDDPDALVFTNKAGNPLIHNSFTQAVFKPALKAAKIDKATRIHDLRHTSVALSILAGAHPKAIQSRMGHASITVTLDRYGHLFPEIDEEVAVELDKLRAGATPDQKAPPTPD